MHLIALSSSAGSARGRNNKLMRKEDSTMTYQKPELTRLGNALNAIQGNPKGTGMQDNPGHVPAKFSVAAYEADE
jgi:hypothetical protein